MGLYLDEADNTMPFEDTGPYIVVVRANGAIEVWDQLGEGDKALFGLPAGFPVEHLADVLAVFEAGQQLGEHNGRQQMQTQLRALLGVDKA